MAEGSEMGGKPCWGMAAAAEGWEHLAGKSHSGTGPRGQDREEGRRGTEAVGHLAHTGRGLCPGAVASAGDARSCSP